MRSYTISFFVHAAMLVALPAHGADSYPNRPIRLVAPFPPGTGADVIGRALGRNLAERLGQSIVVDNRPGASGVIAAELVAKSQPDGYTLMLATINTHSINLSMFSKLPYHPVRDFSPVSLVGTSPNVLVANPSFPAKTVAELIDLARARGGTLKFGSPGTGTSPHLSSELLNTIARVKATHVPYKGGPQALTDVIAGHIDYMFVGLSAALPLVNAGRIKALAVTSAKRQPSVPDVPTMLEAGVKDFVVVAWYGIAVPSKVAPAIVRRLNVAIVAGIENADVRARLNALGVDPVSSTPESFAALIRDEIVRWAAVVKASGARVE